MRIVIASGNPLMLKIVSDALNTNPASEIPLSAITSCTTALDGIAACRDRADLAIFDNDLPDLPVAKAVARLRAGPQTRDLPLLILTDDKDHQTRRAAIAAGASDCLTRPVDPEELRMRMHLLLALTLARQQAAERQILLEAVIAASGAQIAVADAQDPETPVLFVSEALLTRSDASLGKSLGPGSQGLWRDAPDAPGCRALQAAVAARTGGRFILGAAPVSAPPIAVTLMPVPAPGAAARFLVITQEGVTDMTDMREARDRLAGRLTDIARVSGAWFFEFDAARRLTYVSDTLAHALGTTPAQLLGLKLEDLPVQPDEADPATAWAEPLFSPPYQRVENEMVVFRRSNGQIRSIQINAVPFHDAQGAFAGYRGHASDVSEIARARDLAARASQAKTVFLATMSHEMRTPLTAIIGLAELMARDALPAQKDHLDEIARAASGLAGVLSDVLDVASMEQGRLSLNAAPFDPAGIIAQAVAPHRLAASRRNLSFDWRTDCIPAAPRLGDGARVRQIVQALVSNAVKFTERGGVSVLLDCSGAEAIHLTVTDTGIGMRPEDQETAFTPFMQADGGIARRFDGSGLGLSIACWLTRSMGGTITLDSACGQGTTVRVSLPLPRIAAAPAGRAGLAGWRVLVADDNHTNRKILHAMLRRMGAAVTLCTDGSEALEHWRKGGFDALLLDINMPRMAGTEVIRRIRRQESLQGAAPVPAIAVTANAGPEQVAHYRTLGFDGCVPKPFTMAALFAALQKHASRTPA